MTDTPPGPLASLVTSTTAALSVRPSIAARSVSSRSLPSSTHPRLVIALSVPRLPTELAQGLREIAAQSVRGNVILLEDDDPPEKRGAFVWVVGFRKDPGFGRRWTVSSNYDDFAAVPPGSNFEVEIVYNRPIEAFRGLGHVLGISRGLSSFSYPDAASSTDADSEAHGASLKWTSKVGAELNREETCLFESVGVMLDCSRNGVLLVDSVKFMLRQLALSGTNVLQLYCEDTYQIPGEPFFGYFRGPYSESELREIDNYAFSLGIEVVACIQTLGHLGQMLQWSKYSGLRDTTEVLLAESAETYKFIEKMISAISGPLRSRRIHIGMDEAHGVSEGRYRQFFGYKDSTKVFTDHLHRVNAICVRAGLSPMIWSDMLFCLPAKNNALSTYYDPNSSLPSDLSDSIPHEIDLVFWNYYQTSATPYIEKIKQHWQLAGRAPWVASGVWTWSRFWTALPFTFATIKAAMKAARAPSSKVTAVMTTIWGDEGNECDIFSALPGILYHADLAYTESDEVDAKLLRNKFDGITGADFDDYVYASKLDVADIGFGNSDTQPESQPIDEKTHYTPNLSKFLLWEDPFFSMMSPQYQGFDLESHFDHLAEYLDQALSDDFSSMNTISVPHSVQDFPANKRLLLPSLLARVLSLKCHLRERLVYAYKQNDRTELVALAGPHASSRMSRLNKLVKRLHQAHRRNWFATYKPFGWEVLDLRYGGLRSRLETMHERLIAFLDPDDSSVSQLDELEVKLEVVYPGQGPNLMLDYARVSRPQYI